MGDIRTDLGFCLAKLQPELDAVAEQLVTAPLHEVSDDERAKLIAMARVMVDHCRRLDIVVSRSSRKAEIKWRREQLDAAILRDQEAEATLDGVK